MSEAWHQHLQNLTWWEQIDRFFNPSKYSCSTWGTDAVYQTFLIVMFCLIILGAILTILIYYQNKKETKNFRYIGDEPDKKELY